MIQHSKVRILILLGFLYCMKSPRNTNLFENAKIY